MDQTVLAVLAVQTVQSVHCVTNVDFAGIALLVLVGFACTTASKVRLKLQRHVVQLSINVLAGMVQTHTVNDLEGVD
jgi:hypothetical protein